MIKENNQRYGIVGLGVTGLSCARFLTQQQQPFIVMDTRQAPPALAAFRAEFPNIEVITGDNWPSTLFDNMHTCVVSPGVSVQDNALQRAQAQGVEIIGDIALFLRFNRQPIIAITEDNEKSTVATLVSEMVRAAGKQVALVGNIGTPVLDLLNTASSTPDIIVMELSSFQLETTSNLGALAATVLNITPDHLDRYTDFAAYAAAKHRIFQGAQQVVINAHDSLSLSETIPPDAKRWHFTLQAPAGADFGVRITAGKPWLAQGETDLLPVEALPIQGQHNVSNALAALALGSAAGLPMAAMLQALQTFTGLSHRCQLVANKNNIRWINDSKGTNVGACEAALKGLGVGIEGKLLVLLGGDGKGADFAPLAEVVKRYCKVAIVMGKDAPLIAKALGAFPVLSADTMAQAVAHAKAQALPGDIVLLSPACASLDQYRDYMHRGEVFMHEVKKVLQ